MIGWQYYTHTTHSSLAKFKEFFALKFLISKAWIHTDSDDEDLSIVINRNEDQVIKVMQNMLLEKYTRMGMKTTPVTDNDLAVAGVDKSLNSSPESRLIWQ